MLADPAFRRFALISGLIVLCGYAQFHAALPIYLSRPGGLAPTAVALVFAANTVTVTVAAIPSAVAVRHVKATTLTAAGAATWLTLAASGQFGRTFTGVVIACGAGAVILSTGTIAGPLIAATLYSGSASPYLFLFLIGGCVCAAAISIHHTTRAAQRRRHDAPVPAPAPVSRRDEVREQLCPR